jgi:hypothetical protein
MAAAQVRSSAIVLRDDFEIVPNLNMTAHSPAHAASSKKPESGPVRRIGEPCRHGLILRVALAAPAFDPRKLYANLGHIVRHDVTLCLDLEPD